MPRTRQRKAGTTAGADKSWRSMYIVGGIAALLSLAGTLLDIALTMIPGWETTTVPGAMSAWLVQLQTNPLLGLRNLDLLNAIMSLIGIPTYLAIAGAQRKSSIALSALGLALVLIGDTVFVSANAALPMLSLSQRYAQAGSDAQRLAIEAAGQALLARGAHGSLGAFAGFLLPSIGSLLIGVTMLNGGVFGRLTGWLSIVGMGLLTIYTIANTFTPAISDIVMMLALPGGLLLMVWYVRVAVELFRLGAPQAQHRG